MLPKVQEKVTSREGETIKSPEMQGRLPRDFMVVLISTIPSHCLTPSQFQKEGNGSTEKMDDIWNHRLSLVLIKNRLANRTAQREF